jgi:bacteriocin-like protein
MKHKALQKSKGHVKREKKILNQKLSEAELKTISGGTSSYSYDAKTGRWVYNEEESE